MKKPIILLVKFTMCLFISTSFSNKSFAETKDTRETTANFQLVAPTDTLKITEATDLTFADAVISAEDIVTTNSGDTKVTIEELSGEAPGWQLSAKLDNFTGSTSKKKLIGAQVFYPSITPTTTNAVDTSTTSPTTVSKDNSFQGGKSGVILTAGADATNIVTAAKGTGYGKWSMNYSKGEVQLKVPAGNLKDTYTATLTYTLVDSPQ